MAGFGKADIGLIKATAGAEAGQHIDKNLMMGSAIGVALDSISAQKAAVQKQNAKLQKQIDAKFSVPSSNLDESLRDFAHEEYSNATTNYAGIKGSDFHSKSQQQNILEGSEDMTKQIDNMQGLINYTRDKKNKPGPGRSEKDKFYWKKMQDGSGLQYFKTLNSDGKYTLNMAVPRPGGEKPELTKGIKALKDLKEKGKIDAKGLKALAVYDKSVKDYNKWLAMDVKVGGAYNNKKYKIFNGTTMFQGEDMVNKKNLLNVWGTNIVSKTESKDLNKNPTVESYEAEWKNVFAADNANLTGAAIQDIAFGDFSNDNIDNSFASVFMGGANLEKHPNLYKDEDGNPIKWDLKKIGLTKEEIEKYDKKKDSEGRIIPPIGDVEGERDGELEWTPMYDENDDLIHSEWNALPPETKERMLEVWIRGTDKQGDSNPDTRADWIKDKYAKFMGVVTLDAYKAKQKDHFTNKGVYFDSQGEKGDQSITRIFDSASDMQTQKRITYNKTKLNVAFPESFIESGVTTTDDPLTRDITIDNNLTKALPNLQSKFPGIKFKVKEGKLVVGEGDDKERFDFSGNGISNKNEYKRLTALLVGEETTLGDSVKIKGLGTSIDDQNWKDFRHEQYDLYPENRVKQDFGYGKGVLAGGQYEKFTVKNSEGVSEEISTHKLKIISYNKASGKYMVQVGGEYSEQYPPQLVDLQLKK